MDSKIDIDSYYMELALEQAEAALKQREVPIGAVLVKDNKLLAATYNQKEQWNDPTAHAEMIAIRKAAKQLGDWRLYNTTLYVTAEPCIMCAGAIVQARITRIVFAAYDPKAWGDIEIYDVLNNPLLNHKVTVIGGFYQERAKELLTNFFQHLRKQNNNRDN